MRINPTTKTRLMGLDDRMPDSLSELFKHALGDFKIARRRSHISVDMDASWLRHADPVCFICLVGAVMLVTYQIDPDDDVEISPLSFRESVRKKFNAIDALRRGKILLALQILDIVPTSKQRTMLVAAEPTRIPNASKDYRAWSKSMKAICQALVRAGL